MTITNELVSVSARYAIEFADKAVPIVRKQISTAQVYANGSGAKNGLTGIKPVRRPVAKNRIIRKGRKMACSVNFLSSNQTQEHFR